MIEQTSRGKQRVFMELTDLEIGPQPASLFEVPDNYRAMPGGMGGMGSMGGMGGMASPYGGMSGAEPAGRSGAGYLEQLEQMKAERASEKEARAARARSQGDALSRLTLDYLEGCWSPSREAAQIRINADGSYDVGTPAGSGYAMTRMGDSIQQFRERFDGLVSLSDNRFVVTDRSRETTYERGECVGGSHSVAGTSGPGQGYGRGGEEAPSEGNPLGEATDKIKRGLDSLFNQLK